MQWTCDPPEFAAYVANISIVDRGDFAAILVDMRCKRVPANAEIERRDEGEHEVNTGRLVITYFPNDVDANVVWPEELGPFTGEAAPQVTIHLGRTDMALQHFEQGRYSILIALMREGLWHERTEIPQAPSPSIPL